MRKRRLRRRDQENRLMALICSGNCQAFIFKTAIITLKTKNPANIYFNIVSISAGAKTMISTAMAIAAKAIAATINLIFHSGKPDSFLTGLSTSSPHHFLGK